MQANQVHLICRLPLLAVQIMQAMQLGLYLVSLKPLKLPVATNMARLTGAAMERHRRYVTAIFATSPLAFMAVPHNSPWLHMQLG